MKQFLKFIVSIIVISIIVFTVYFLMQNTSKYIENDISGDLEDIPQINSGDNSGIQINKNENFEVDNSNNIEENLEHENDAIEITSGDSNVSGEDIDIDVSGETISENNIYTIQEIEQKVTDIKEIEKQNESVSVPKTFEDSVGLDIIGVENKEFFTVFNLTELTVTIQTAGSMVYIIPNSDFIDNAQYHYDTNGNLALYVRELIGVGGEMRYYYENGQFLKEEKVIDEDIEIAGEDTKEILQRAKLVYEKYMK